MKKVKEWEVKNLFNFIKKGRLYEGGVQTLSHDLERIFPDVESPFHVVERKFHDGDLFKQFLICNFAPCQMKVCTATFYIMHRDELYQSS